MLEADLVFSTDELSDKLRCKTDLGVKLQLELLTGIHLPNFDLLFIIPFGVLAFFLCKFSMLIAFGDDNGEFMGKDKGVV